MTWKRLRWVRIVTVTVPCLWFFFVLFSLFTLNPTRTPPHHHHHHPHHLYPHPEKKSHLSQVPETRLKERTGSQLGAKDPSRDSSQFDVNTENRVLRLSSNAKPGLKRDKDYIRRMKIDSAKDGVTRMVVRDREWGRNLRKNLRDGRLLGKGRDDVNSDVMKGMGDVYANVTFPPYVERLLFGAKGQGPQGLPIEVGSLSVEQQKEYREKWKKNEFNQYSSDLMPVHRQLPDYRSDKCQKKEYPVTSLPVMSVVMVFHNEAWSVLLRSVHSILDRSPPDLLKEIILVDDFSDMDHLKKPLDKYFLHYSKVKIVRMSKRGGLIQARLQGFEATSGEVVVFLDSHIECTTGWAEPLLWLVAQNYKTVPFPVIDMIHKDSLAYIKLSMSPYGSFSMNSLTFTWTFTIDRAPHPVTGARPSPTMPGGLFAISRKWFQELGGFDPDLEYWGGENMELSFKTWMCGGSIVIADCSHIGHIFRAQNPITWSRPLGSYNYVRVAMVWMDQYKNHYFERINYRTGDYGDVSKRQALRARLQCHSFGWYIENVFPELKQQLVFNATFAGQIQHEESGLCLDKLSKEQMLKSPQLMGCHHQGGNQFWYFRDDLYLQSDTFYLCQKTRAAGAVGLCFDAVNYGEWSYNPETRQLHHMTSGQCLQPKPGTASVRDVMLAPCLPLSTAQRWNLDRRKPFRYK